MKTFIRTIVILALISVAMEGFTLADEEQDQTSQRTMETAQREVERAQREVERSLRGGKVTLSMPPIIMTQNYGGAGSVLVIPAGQINPEDLAAVMEDMTVMSRIFDKKLTGSNMLDSRSFGRRSSVTEGIYLQGYAALFMMKVDFPLLAPPESPKEQKTQQDIDPLWEQTKREIYEPQGSRSSRSSRTRRGGGGINDSSAVKYDADKVEELKRKLINELKHAANIRNLQPDESIIITVTGCIIPGVIILQTIRIVLNLRFWDRCVLRRMGISPN